MEVNKLPISMYVGAGLAPSGFWVQWSSAVKVGFPEAEMQDGPTEDMPTGKAQLRLNQSWGGSISVELWSYPTYARHPRAGETQLQCLPGWDDILSCTSSFGQH